MRIWHKILVAPGVAIVSMLALGAVSWQMFQRQNAALEDLARTRMTASQAAAEAAGDFSDVHSSVYRLFTWTAGPPDVAGRKMDAEQQRKLDEIGATLARLAALPTLSAAERRMVSETLTRVAAYRKLMEEAVDLSSLDVGNGAAAMQRADTQYLAVRKAMDQLVRLEKRLGEESYQAVAAAGRTAAAVLAAILAIAVAAAIASALAMSTAIVRPLRAAIAVAGRIAEGDLTARLQVRGSDETADLLRALQAMSQNLRDLVGQVSGGAHLLADTSAQIAQGNQDLSQRTEEQASTLEETASSMEELTSTVSLNAQNARQASQVALGASEIARKGGEVVSQVVSTMNGISDSSCRIGDIIGVIDGIAFQTNILALNAAVEAARAGEQGRGFAVVAAEVRSLAQRSAAAAKEIKGLIGASVDKVDAGARLVDSAGNTMQEIVASVKKVSDLIAEIAAASEEQDAGIRQVNAAIAQMDQVVQQNASLVEQAVAATESMKGQSGSLLHLVARFKLGEAEAAPAPVRPGLAAGAAAPFQAAPAPKPIAVKPEPRFAAAVPVLDLPVLPHQGANGEWQEF